MSFPTASSQSRITQTYSVSAALGTVLLGLVVWSCSAEKAERPPLWQGGGTTTGSFPVGGVGTGEGNNEGGAGNSDGETVATGRVETFQDARFILTAPYTEAAQIWVMERAGSDSTRVDYNGMSFTTPLTRRSQWMAVKPDFDQTHMTTISLWDGIEVEPTLNIVPRAVLSDILGGLIGAATVGDARAHALIQVFDPDGKTPMAGVMPTVGAAEGIAFYDQGVWSDVDDMTAQSGLFLAYNISAGPLVGQDNQVILSGTVDAEFSVRLAEGAVTIVTYVSK